MVVFKEKFSFDGQEFDSFKSLGKYLSENFRKGMEIVKDGRLFNLIESEDEKLYQELTNLTKNFEYLENVLTLTIYFLDNSLGIITPNYRFRSNYEIADLMKSIYPNVDNDIKTLFYDKALADIFWNEYLKHNDNRYKRNYTFMLHIYENRMYDFTYYYYLFLHLDKNETIRFTLDGIKMKSVGEIADYLGENEKRASVIIDEIMQNPFILALIAINAGIDLVAAALQSSNKFAILRPLEKFSTVSLLPIIKHSMAYWLLSNYQCYNYETEEAKAILVAYGKLNHQIQLNTIGDYLKINDEVYRLYQTFISLFNYHNLVEYKKGITATSEYYLCYRYNDEYVCEKFLKENGLFDETIHTDLYRDEVEREVLITDLNKEKFAVDHFKTEVLELTGELNFNHRDINRKQFIAFMFIVIAIVTLVASYFNGNIRDFNDLTGIVNIALYCCLGVGFIFTLIAAIKYTIKDMDADLVELALSNSDVSLNSIDKEAKLIANKSTDKGCYDTLINLKRYERNRNNDLIKIKKIANKKQKVNPIWLVLGSSLLVLPFTAIVSELILSMFELKVFGIYISSIPFNFIYLIYLLVFATLVIIFRKKNLPYFTIYLLLVVSLALSFIFR